WKVVVTGTDCTPSIVWEMTPPPVVVPLPPMPVWTDTCGVNNGYWTYPADGNGYTWKIVDHSTLNGKVGVIVTLTDPNEVFPHGKNYKQWTAVQDNTECPPVVPEKPEPVVKTTTDEALDCEAKTVTTVTT